MQNNRPANAPKITNELLVTECGYSNIGIDTALLNIMTMLNVSIVGMSVRCNMEEFDKSVNRDRVAHGTIGLSTEIGELLDAYKKHWFYKKDLDMDNVLEEIGDLIWYYELLIDEVGQHPVMKIKLQSIREMMGNLLLHLEAEYDDCRNAVIRKLRVRYPNNFTEFDADNRDTKAEMEAFNDVKESPKKKKKTRK